MQHVCEQLECRARPVRVDMEPGEADSDDFDYAIDPPYLEVVGDTDDEAGAWSG